MSNRLPALAPVLCLLVGAVTCADAPVRLSVDGWTEHLIVIPDAASVEVQAAAELCMHLEQVCPLPGALYLRLGRSRAGLQVPGEKVHLRRTQQSCGRARTRHRLGGPR